MNRLLNEIAYRGFCTWMALATVWAYRIQSPLSWTMIGLAAAVDIAALVVPRRRSEGQRFRVPITDVVAAATIGVLALLAVTAPFIQNLCDTTTVSNLNRYVPIIDIQLNVFGGACEAHFGYSVAWSIFVFFFSINAITVISRIHNLFARPVPIGLGVMPMLVNPKKVRSPGVWLLAIGVIGLALFATLSFDPEGRSIVYIAPMRILDLFVVSFVMSLTLMLVNSLFVVWEDRNWGIKR
ncbi:hypothetical protein [Salinarimonas ramus]|uniref:Uncharacterized protein n=1 Tax=Salinarimonas ramus TaxID=690164 RepID=A0A917V2V9_9HYPH|nr:hypothetical protein [Salinarimonas ramus]GGK25157.1 hypothetical protein GCM10011322_09640 [Salinarimonas ramus]